MTTRAAGQPPSDTMPAAPPIRFDDRGRAIPPTGAERAARAEAIRKGLEVMATFADDDPPGSDAESWRALDAGRPERPLMMRYYRP